jgi:hypothetical protein
LAFHIATIGARYKFPLRRSNVLRILLSTVATLVAAPSLASSIDFDGGVTIAGESNLFANLKTIDLAGTVPWYSVGYDTCRDAAGNACTMEWFLDEAVAAGDVPPDVAAGLKDLVESNPEGEYQTEVCNGDVLASAFANEQQPYYASNLRAEFTGCTVATAWRFVSGAVSYELLLVQACGNPGVRVVEAPGFIERFLPSLPPPILVGGVPSTPIFGGGGWFTGTSGGGTPTVPIDPSDPPPEDPGLPPVPLPPAALMLLAAITALGFVKCRQAV